MNAICRFVCVTDLFVVWMFYLLQAIKVLGCEKGKKKKTNLVFVAGNRVLKYLARCYKVEKDLMGILR